MNILIVDDEKQLVDALVQILKQQKYNVDAAYDGITGLDLALYGQYDLIILDIMLPAKNGLDVLKELRDNNILTKVILLSAKSEIDDKITGLNKGADDYLTKPFDSLELLARIRALLRRQDNLTLDVMEIANVKLDRTNHLLKSDNQNILLGSKEFQIMEMLFLNKNNIIPKERFVEKVWGYDSDAEYNTIEVYISFLRKKLSAIDAKLIIKAYRGSGYKLEEI